jgi:hypothetical protein
VSLMDWARRIGRGTDEPASRPVPVREPEGEGLRGLRSNWPAREPERRLPTLDRLQQASARHDRAMRRGR